MTKKHKVPMDILQFAITVYPAKISKKVVEHYQSYGELPDRISFQTDLRGSYNIFYPKRQFASHSFALAKQVAQQPVTATHPA